MSQDQEQWETAHQESQQDPDLTPEDKAELRREKEAEYQRKWAEKERKWAEMKTEVEARHHKATDQQQTSNQPQAWAHWEYTPKEWAQLDRLDWRRTVRMYWLTVGPGILGLLACFALVLWGIMFYMPLAFLLLFTAMPLFLTLLIVLLVIGRGFFKGSVDRPTTRRHKARQNTSSKYTVTLSGKGMWQAGVFFPLERPFFSGESGDDREDRVILFEVRLSTQPTILHFRVEHDIAYGGGFYPIQETIPLLVPQAYESEAEQIAHRYRKDIEARERESAMVRAEQEARAHPREPI